MKLEITMIRTLIAASLAAAAVTFTASAEDVVIDISAVDFDDQAQAAAIFEQIVDASREVCADMYVDHPTRAVSYFERQRLYASCVENTVAETVAAAELPELSAVFASASFSPYAVASK
jgi:hypothetical protein